MALSNLALFGGAFFTPVLVGKITSTIGWEWSFYLVAIFAGALLPLVFFFVPETAFTRPSNPYVEALENGTSQRPDACHKPTPANGSTYKTTPDTSNPTSFEKHDYNPQAQMSSDPPPKATYAQSLLPLTAARATITSSSSSSAPFPSFCTQPFSGLASSKERSSAGPS